MADTAEIRLHRLLHVLAVASRPGGATLEELAATLGCEPARVLRDIQEATDREYYQPGGSVEPFQISVEHDRVRVRTSGEFRRPSRLTRHEALALGLAVRALAAESAADRRTELLALAGRLESELAAPPTWEVTDAAEMPAFQRVEVRERAPTFDDTGAGAEPPVFPEPLGDREPGLATRMVDDVVAEAAEQRRRCVILYLKPGDAAPAERDIAPYRLVYAAGRWYTLAHDAARDAVRVFRFDRILEARLTAERFEVPSDFDPGDYLKAEGAPFLALGEVKARVRYSAVVSPWVAEATGVAPADDGTLVLEHPVADEEWLIRHVLRYGGEAEVLEPAVLRERVGAAAGRLV